LEWLPKTGIKKIEMVERIVIDQEQMPQLVQEWLAASGVSDELEV
jgi:hypothetical protein